MNLTLSYSPDDRALAVKERLHASLIYKHFLWTAGLRWNAGDFYDLFGPTKRSREGYSAFIDYEQPLVYAPPETLYLVTKLAYFGDLDALPGFQNVASPDRPADRGARSASSTSTRARRSARSTTRPVILWSVLVHAYEAEGNVTPSVLGKFDVGWQLPVRALVAVAAHRCSASRPANVDDPLSNAYFGGFRNNYVDSGEAKRYRELLSMPGFEIDALNGRSFVKGMLELNLPPIRFEKLGSPGFYGSWIRPALFTTALVTNPDSAAGQGRCVQCRPAVRPAVARPQPTADDAVPGICAGDSRVTARVRTRSCCRSRCSEGASLRGAPRMIAALDLPRHAWRCCPCWCSSAP